MTIRLHHIIIVLFIILLGGLFWWRVSPRVLAEKKSPSRSDRIVVREILYNQFCILSILRINECIYRCEYYMHPKWSMSSAISLGGPSCYINKVDIQWLDSQTAIVMLGNEAVFKCKNGNWTKANIQWLDSQTAIVTLNNDAVLKYENGNWSTLPPK